MTAVAAAPLHPPLHLDFKLVVRGVGYFGCICAVVAPLTSDPIAFGVGALVPWFCLRVLYTPAMPTALLYIFLWEWLQIFARVPQTWIDGDTLSTTFYGPNVAHAYWYMMASLIVLAVTFRAVLARVKLPTPAQRNAHLRWTVRDLALFYIGASIVSMAGVVVGNMSGGLAQPAEAIGRLKIVAMFTLFVYVMSTGRGVKVMLGVILFEVAIGFTGLLSDFRSVFIFLAIAAVTARIQWKWSTAVLSLVGLTVLTSLALFWTAVKTDYRDFASQSGDTQALTVPLSERMAYLGNKFMHVGDINLADTAYLLLIRFAYVDIFGSVIDAQEMSPEPIAMRQWKEAFEHVLQPRFLFPGKAELSDSDVYIRLTHRFAIDELIAAGTSISVGYMGENYADLGFPGMLVGIAFLGAILAACVRILMSFNMPQVFRQGLVMAFAFSMARDGVEVSLPKILGAALMFMLVFVSALKFIAPRIVEWLDYGGSLGKVNAPRRVKRP